MAFTYTDDYNNTLTITDELACDDNEEYLDNPIVIGTGYNTNLNMQTMLTFSIDDFENISVSAKNNRYCFVLANNATYGDLAQISAFVSSGVYDCNSSFDILVHREDYPDWHETNQSTFPLLSWMSTDPLTLNGTNITQFATNIPIFDHANASHAADYLTAETPALIREALSHAINYGGNAEYALDTRYWYISNERGQATCVGNTATPVGDKSWRSMRFYSNSTPVMYFNTDYSITLVASNVLKSATITGPDYMLDNVPESQWTQNALAYTGLWYGSIERRLRYTEEMLPDGVYMYGFGIDTNIPIFKDQSSAEDAIARDDYTGAGNYPVISGGEYPPPLFGEEEDETTFGGGADTSPFVQTYVLSRSALIQCAQAWYNTDPATIADILTGLKMFGDKPYESLAGITLYPFDVTRIVNTSVQSYIYFGTYQMQLTGVSLNKAISLKSNAYLDCGTIYLAPLQRSYRDFEPYTQLDVYLPYIGWQRMDIGLLINKRVNVRYYVDIHTRACVACILANGVLVATYNGTIGVGLPVTSADYQGYANSACSAILGGGSNMLSSAGKTLAAAVGGNYLGALANVGAAGVATASTLFKLDKLGAPADHATTRGNFTSCLGMYMPQSVLWRYTIHDAVEPSGFADLCGKPSNKTGSVSSFSGYLSCKQVKLNTSGMLDNEVAEIETLLKGGIFV